MDKPRHILSVEDNKDSSEMIAIFLQSVGYRVTSAPPIAEALKLLEGHDYDLFLLDRILPDGDGIDLCKEIRATDTLTPIVFYSAAAYDHDKERGMAAGAQAYLTKPEVADELEAVIAALIEKHESAV